MLIVYYLIIVNLTAFLMYGLDKWKAIHKRWRIPEAELLCIALVGGAFGAYGAMLAFRHKTRHPQFSVGVPIMMLLWALGLAWFIFS